MPFSDFLANHKQLCNGLLLSAGFCLALAGCDSDLETDLPDGGNEQPVTPVVTPPTGSAGQASNDSLTLQVGDGAITVEEGAGTVNVPVSITRNSTDINTVQLSASASSTDDGRLMTASFTEASLAANVTATSLNLQLAIDSLPIRAQTRNWIVSASVDDSVVISTEIAVSITPTPRPDVYLLIGQSNMVGFSEDDSKDAGSGGLDEPNARIKQLNVTGNDGENFSTAADFTTAASVYVTGMPETIAVDPLHDGFDSNIAGKAGQRIGPGLSFAKRALADTTADIILVPAAWSDTGFCKRDTNRLPGIGWNATAKSNSALAGTLLYQRAVLRTNIALSEFDGVLRGILWHQGEADSDAAACAQVYAENLTELATALRTNINQDARGAAARGANAELPFIVGTMSMGDDGQSTQIPFSDTQLLVDDAHRSIASLIPVADFVNNDDLVPPAYPCGEGSCVHFGAAAYREMGVRYYERLIGLLR